MQRDLAENRHGAGRSAVVVLNTFVRFRIILTNAVKYVTNVESYDRCIQGGNCPFEDEIIVQVGKKRRPAVCLRPERAGT